jgi:hypothetical protein
LVEGSNPSGGTSNSAVLLGSLDCVLILAGLPFDWFVITSARLLPDLNRKNRLVFQGRSYPLVRDRFGLRLRSRSVSHPINYCTGTFNLALAKKLAKQHLEKSLTQHHAPTARTAHDLVEAYKLLSKRAAVRAEKYNVQRFKAVLKESLGRPLKSIRLHEITPKVWMDFMAKRQGLPRADLSIRRPEHTTINTAVRCARSLLIESLRQGYRELGLDMPAAGNIQWLQEVKKVPATFQEAEMLAQWEKLERNDPVWWTVGIGRFVGLRKEEIAACRGGWLVQSDGVWCLEVRDRPEENYYCKTGHAGLSPILHAELIERLQAIPSNEWVVTVPGCRANWFDRVTQRWLRTFMKDVAEIAKPLHRLRAAYLTAVKRTEMMRLQSEALKITAAAARHTSDRTTRKHYLPTQLGQ